MALDNLRGGTKRVMEENTPLNNLRGGTKRVVIVDGGGGSVDYAKTVQRAETMPTADSSNAGQQFLYSGESDATYTHGYIYECVSDGGNPATYSWTRVDVQPAGSSLPDQTGQSGKFLTTDGTDASWSDKPLVNNATGGRSLSIGGNAVSLTDVVCIGDSASVSTFADKAVAIGAGAYVPQICSMAIGYKAYTTAGYAIQLNASGTTATNSQQNTFKVANANGNFELMSADGTVPTARLTKVNTTATLAVAGWSSNTQTVTVSGVKADSVVFVSPAPASASDYASAGILCTAQAADSLTFTCTTTPSNAITVNVVCM